LCGRTSLTRVGDVVVARIYRTKGCNLESNFISLLYNDVLRTHANGYTCVGVVNIKSRVVVPLQGEEIVTVAV
jgi:hypothetical protein